MTPIAIRVCIATCTSIVGGPFFLHVCPFSRPLSTAFRFTFDIPDYPWQFGVLSESTWPGCRPPRWQST